MKSQFTLETRTLFESERALVVVVTVRHDDAVVAVYCGGVLRLHEFEAQAVLRDLKLTCCVLQLRLRLAGTPQIPLSGWRRKDRLAVNRHIPLQVSAGVLQASVFLSHRRAGYACLLKNQH